MSSIPQNLALLEVPQHPETVNGNGQTKAQSTQGEHPTDCGNATRFLTQHGQQVRYCCDYKKWLIFKDGVWQVDRTQEVFHLAELTVRSLYHEAGSTTDKRERKVLASWALRCETESRIQGMLNIAKTRAGVPVLPEDLDSDPWVFSVANGTIELKTGAFRPHKQSDLITKKNQVCFDPAASAPKFQAFLARIIPNAQVRQYLQKAVGYSLTGCTAEQVMFFLYGKGANGKSTLLDLIHAVLGDYGLSTPTSTLTVKQQDGIPNDIARLKGVRFVSAVETDDGKRLAESVLKQLTGDKRIPARFMRGEWFDFEPIMKLWLATNHKPQVRGTDDGIWRRIRLIPFTVTIPEAEQDKNLYDKLKEELPGILNWALEGLRLWLTQGLGEPSEVMAATLEYRQEQDSLNSFFEERCMMEANAHITAKELYACYVAWCEENGERALSQRLFGQRLAERGFTKKKSSVIVWFGLRLRGQSEQPGQQQEETWEDGRNEDQNLAFPSELSPCEPETEKIIPNPPIIPGREDEPKVEDTTPEHMQRLRNGMQVDTPDGRGIVERCWPMQVCVNILGVWKRYTTPMQIAQICALPGEYERVFKNPPEV